jgi:hypothetical protein
MSHQDKKMWPTKRRKEIGLVQELLKEASMINNGNHCLERIRKVIKLAKRLDKVDLRKGEPSFTQWLIRQAYDE